MFSKFLSVALVSCILVQAIPASLNRRSLASGDDNLINISLNGDGSNVETFSDEDQAGIESFESHGPTNDIKIRNKVENVPYHGRRHRGHRGFGHNESHREEEDYNEDDFE